MTSQPSNDPTPELQPCNHKRHEIIDSVSRMALRQRFDVVHTVTFGKARNLIGSTGKFPRATRVPALVAFCGYDRLQLI